MAKRWSLAERNKLKLALWDAMLETLLAFDRAYEEENGEVYADLINAANRQLSEVLPKAISADAR